jgi:hypothetical protein
MLSVIDSSKPRGDIVAGSFNPEIFTASLSEVMRFYRGRTSAVHPLYTDAELRGSGSADRDAGSG